MTFRSIGQKETRNWRKSWWVANQSEALWFYANLKNQ